ncbi:thiamine-phosphate kinase [Actomonas aquatica]|uniref:Thiamine-monophosphate kinase n=1 Tax=Actomonas aquatica TaxID=2866162 RepID=A0ABZ1CBX9_9BACT|nr:thiamine-phosphate kinase [Opitutus sp. WL0086]WRQ89172.1 thiamine-phosphate kinase [Opitutus sp. WL0086]
MSPFTTQRRLAVTSLGEAKLIGEIRRWLSTASPRPPGGIGDDCAVLAGSMRDQLITVDPVIYGEHFDDSVPARGVGAKLFNRNLSDIASMGGRPRAAVIALALNEQVRLDWLREFYRSLATIARQHRVPIIGGDIAHHASGLIATMTIIGEAPEDRPLTRQGAAAGDWIFVTGTLGGSRLGWHYKFSPRLAEGQWLARHPHVRSMMDVSDGLAKDVHALTPNACRAALDGKALPISRSARKLATTSGVSPLHHALTDGEDYELLFTLSGKADPAAFIAEWREIFRRRLTCIGRFVKRRARSPYTDELDLASVHGFEHLR